LGGCRMTGMEMGGIVLGGWDVGMGRTLISGWGGTVLKKPYRLLQ
jgi:hypothetical protein